MIEYLTFEICKSNNKSVCIRFFQKGDLFYLKTAFGLQGVYVESSIKTYQLESDFQRIISLHICPLKIYAWPKAIPAGYLPKKCLMGCENNTWSIDYKETEKKTARHINGRGPFPQKPPFIDFLDCIKFFIPEEDMAGWLESE